MIHVQDVLQGILRLDNSDKVATSALSRWIGDREVEPARVLWSLLALSQMSNQQQYGQNVEFSQNALAAAREISSRMRSNLDRFSPDSDFEAFNDSVRELTKNHYARFSMARIWFSLVGTEPKANMSLTGVGCGT